MEKTFKRTSMKVEKYLQELMVLQELWKLQKLWELKELWEHQALCELQELQELWEIQELQELQEQWEKLLHMGTLMKVQLCAIENLRLGFGSSILNFDELPFLSPWSQKEVTVACQKTGRFNINDKKISCGLYTC